MIIEVDVFVQIWAIIAPGMRLLVMTDERRIALYSLTVKEKRVPFHSLLLILGWWTGRDQISREQMEMEVFQRGRLPI